MPKLRVTVEYRTGLREQFLRAARLSGSWDTRGLWAEQWSAPVAMEPVTADDGCPAFRAVVELEDSQVGRSFAWGVEVSTATHNDVWGIVTEVNSATSTERVRSFVLRADGQTDRYYLTRCRCLGANRLVHEGRPDAVRFACWAPNAQAVELVIGARESGYISSRGDGVLASYPMQRGDDGVWETPSDELEALADFQSFDHQPYMYRVTREDGSVAYRTDIYSRCQIGSGGKDPESPRPGEPPWDGTRLDLDGSKSCSVVIDPGRVCEQFDEGVWPETRWLSEEEFWRDEFDPERPPPRRIDDLVIYELHVENLGLGRVDVGTLQDAMDLIPHLTELGINSVELMPMSEFEDRAGWGYSTSHYLAVEYACGGRDQFKHFVRECHRNGIAVILDVVYNHYTFDADRAEWAYDSPLPENNIYYWYEGRSGDYLRPDGGYLDNGSSGWAPRFWSETVRQLFTSSAAALVSEFHFDGLRVDLTQAIHRDNVRHADGRSVPDANLFGQKLLRECSNTLQLIRPGVFLIAEDHTGWRAVYEPTDQGGLGFDATWYADFHHHLVTGAVTDSSHAQLIRSAGYGGDESLRMGWFAAAFEASGESRVAYLSSHDEVGNAPDSGRTVVLAVNGAPLIGDTRRYAEARVRFAAGMTLAAPGTPMFFMGEEVGASQAYRYDDVRAGRETREDLRDLRAGDGARLFRYFSDLIRLRSEHPALRTRDCDVVHAHDGNRVVAFRRRSPGEEILVIGSLNNVAFLDGYRFEDSGVADGSWSEIFSSDAAIYGGSDLRNADTITSLGGVVTVNVPADSVLVLRRQRA